MVPITVLPDEQSAIRRCAASHRVSHGSCLAPEGCTEWVERRFQDRPMLCLSRSVVLRGPDLQTSNQLLVEVSDCQLRHGIFPSDVFIDSNAIIEDNNLQEPRSLTLGCGKCAASPGT
jgi:hypothetical protein